MENTELSLSQIFAASQASFEKKIGEEVKLFVHKDYEAAARPRAGYETDKPNRVVIKQTVREMNDFINFVKEYMGDSTKLFYNDRTVTAIFNYSTADKPDYCDSSADLTLEKTTAYKAFAAVAEGRKLTQKEFVKTLKELQTYIKTEEGTESEKIIELAADLQGIKKVNSVSKNTSNTFTIDAKVNSGGLDTIELPKTITFALPVYKNDVKEITEFEVELFATFEDDNIGISLICYRIEELTDSATKAMTDRICQELDGIPSFRV